MRLAEHPSIRSLHEGPSAAHAEAHKLLSGQFGKKLSEIPRDFYTIQNVRRVARFAAAIRASVEAMAPDEHDGIEPRPRTVLDPSGVFGSSLSEVQRHLRLILQNRALKDFSDGKLSGADVERRFQLTNLRKTGDRVSFQVASTSTVVHISAGRFDRKLENLHRELFGHYTLLLKQLLAKLKPMDAPSGASMRSFPQFTGETVRTLEGSSDDPNLLDFVRRFKSDVLLDSLQSPTISEKLQTALIDPTCRAHVEKLFFKSPHLTQIANAAGPFQALAQSLLPVKAHFSLQHGSTPDGLNAVLTAPDEEFNLLMRMVGPTPSPFFRELRHAREVLHKDHSERLPPVSPKNKAVRGRLGRMVALLEAFPEGSKKERYALAVEDEKKRHAKS